MHYHPKSLEKAKVVCRGLFYPGDSQRQRNLLRTTTLSLISFNCSIVIKAKIRDKIQGTRSRGDSPSCSLFLLMICTFHENICSLLRGPAQAFVIFTLPQEHVKDQDLFLRQRISFGPRLTQRQWRKHPQPVRDFRW